MLVSLTALGIYLREKNKESRLVFWAALICICGGLTGLQVVIEKDVVPYLNSLDSPQLTGLAMLFAGILNFGINTFPYYGILVFFLLYNGYFQSDRWFLAVLSVPLWITLLFYTDLPGDELDEWFIGLWGIGYVLAAVGLAIRPIWLEPQAANRLVHSAVALIFLVPLMSLNAYHFTPDPYSDQLLMIIPVICIGSIVTVLILYLRGTFLGVKRKSMETVHIGTTLIHHSLKNAIGKIKLNALNIRKSLDAERHEEIEPYVENLLKTHDAMMRTMAQISHAVSDNLVVHKEEQDLSCILDEVAESLNVYPNIQVELHYFPLQVPVDRQLLIECLFNICNNAVEAMKEAGTIRIELEGRKRAAVLSIIDTGQGMSTLQLQNVFEPFYSTKHRTGKHFGLGMYQVKKVIEAHKGKVEIRSRQGQGTTIKLILRKSGVRSGHGEH